jgi:hypothetical protein
LQAVWIVVGNGEKDDGFSPELLHQIIEMGNGLSARSAGGVPEFQHDDLPFQFVPCHILQVRPLRHLAELERRRDIADVGGDVGNGLGNGIGTHQQQP